MNMPTNKSDLFESLLATLASKATNMVKSRKDFTEAWDTVVSVVIDGLATVPDCTRLNKLSRVLNDALPSKAEKHARDFLAYAEEYINIPKGTIIYAKNIEKFLCDSEKLRNWSESDQSKIDWAEKKTLSQWLKDRKPAKKTDAEVRAAAIKRFKDAAKFASDSGLYFEFEPIIDAIHNIQ